MLKTKPFFLTCLSVLFLSLTVIGCSTDTYLDDALQVSENRVIELSTRVRDLEIESQQILDDEATRSADQLNTAIGGAQATIVAIENKAQESVIQAQGTTEWIIAEATAQAAIIPDYDTSVYGIIEELNLNGIEVSFWHPFSGIREEELLSLIEEFNSENDFGIIVEASNEGNIDNIAQKITTGIIDRNLPGLTLAYPYQAARFQDSEGLINLETYIDHDTYGLSDQDQDDFFTSIVRSDQLPQFNNSRYSFALDRDMEVLYYNQDFLEQLGFSAPPRDPEEFAEMACAATNAAQETVGLQINLTPSRMNSLIFAQGGEIYNPDNRRLTFNTGPSITAIEQIQQLITDGCALVIDDAFSDQAAFAAQQTLFTIGYASQIPFYTSEVTASELPFEWSVSPLPYTGYEPVQNMTGLSFIIPRNTAEEQLAAWIFISYFTSSDVQVSWVEATDALPVRKSTATRLDNYFANNPEYAVAYDLLQYGKSEPAIVGYSDVQLLIDTALQQILLGEDVSIELADLDTSANQFINQ